MKMGWCGLESAGKSQLMVVFAAEYILPRNRKWAEKRRKLGLPHVTRLMAFDTPISLEFQEAIRKAGCQYLHFYDISELLPLSEVDIFINEINKFFPQRGSEPLTREQAEFLSQGAKDGIDIYFCAQDFSQTHKQFRFLVNTLYIVNKMFGSERPTRSMPPIKHIYGLVVYYEVDPKTFKGDNTTMKEIEDESSWIPSLYWINREDTELYDTSYKVRGTQFPPQYMVQQEKIYILPDGQELKREMTWTKR